MTKKQKVVTIKLRDPDAPARSRKPKPLLNPKQCRMKLLALLKELRPAYAERVTRISPSALIALEGDLINSMTARLRQLPSVGKTLKFD